MLLLPVMLLATHLLLEVLFLVVYHQLSMALVVRVLQLLERIVELEEQLRQKLPLHKLVLLLLVNRVALPLFLLLPLLQKRVLQALCQHHQKQ